MAGVAEDRQIGHTPAQFDGDMPERQIAVHLLVIRAEPSVNNPYPAKPRPIEPFDSPDPKLQVRIDGILYQHGNIRSLQSISYFLHGKRIDRCPRPNPKYINTGF
ncbi:hypothetical protein Barb6_03206 [Bacteroidales bacterium Barb6]|nr:hypothetical protein Barb6_03206 [Bacteroidales bacterium Barb6]